MKILIESMTRCQYAGVNGANYYIRCWREESDYGAEKARKTADIIRNKLGEVRDRKLSITFYTHNILAEALLEIDNMNAVEVLDQDGNGCVYYKDWP